jgi:hypothetical protein
MTCKAAGWGCPRFGTHIKLHVSWMLGIELCVISLGFGLALVQLLLVIFLFLHFWIRMFALDTYISKILNFYFCFSISRGSQEISDLDVLLFCGVF